MKEKFKRFKNGKIVVNVRSQKQYDKFMKMCEEEGLLWSSGDLPTKENVYNGYEEETCIDVNNLTELSYSDIDFYESENWKVITYKDFFKTNQFTKSDLKPHHIVKQRDGSIYVWSSAGYFYNEYLINIGLNCSTDYDIIEVYEFDKLVWKREKPVEILDKVEKKWLKNFIRSTEIKVNYIVKYEKVFYNDKEFLKICYNINGNTEDTMLPYFKEDTMYRNMEVDKKYTLKELGLED